MSFPETASYLLFNRMSPTAAVTSALLHAVVAAAFLSDLPQPELRQADDLIEVTVERPTLPLAEHSTPSTPVAETAGQAPTMEPEQRPVASPAPIDPPAKAKDETPPAPPSQQMAETKPAVVEPTLEQALPPLQAPPPPVATNDFAALLPPAAPRAPTPRSPPQTSSVPRPSQPSPPKHSASQPVSQHVQTPRRPTPSPNAAPARRRGSQRQAEEDYLWQVVRKLSRYRFREKSRGAGEQGLVVTRITIARDGRLLEASLARSSGVPALDQGVMDTIRRASPFAPLPADIADDHFTFTVPLNYLHER